jgi:hypothetical protein
MTDHDRKQMARAARRRDSRSAVQHAWRQGRREAWSQAWADCDASIGPHAWSAGFDSGHDCGVECGFNAALEREAHWVREDTRTLISLEQESAIYERAFLDGLNESREAIERLRARMRELEEAVSP